MFCIIRSNFSILRYVTGIVLFRDRYVPTLPFLGCSLIIYRPTATFKGRVKFINCQFYFLNEMSLDESTLVFSLDTVAIEI